MSAQTDLAALWNELTQTTKGYKQMAQPLVAGTHWYTARQLYDKLAAELAPSPPAVPTDVNGRWYRSNSAWNTPIPANPVIHPENPAMIDAGCRYANSAHPQYTGPLTWCMGPTNSGTPSLWIEDPAQPLKPVQVNYPNGCATREESLRLPAAFAVEGGCVSVACTAAGGVLVCEPVAAFALRDGSEIDLYKLSKPGDPPLWSSNPKTCCGANGLWQVVNSFHTRWDGMGDGPAGSSYRGSSTPAGAGMIRRRDAQSGDGVHVTGWDHALALAYPLTRAAAFAYPAVSTDGDQGARYGFTGLAASQCIPEGARIQLDPSIDVATHLAFSNYQQRQLAKTLQVYGAIVVDTGGALVTEQTVSVAASGYTFPWDAGAGPAKLPASLASSLRVIDPAWWTH